MSLTRRSVDDAGYGRPGFSACGLVTALGLKPWADTDSRSEAGCARLGNAGIYDEAMSRVSEMAVRAVFSSVGVG